MDTNDRLKEIAGNLRRDVKDLLTESASIVAGMFENGLCTVRDAANHWKTFTQGIPGAVVSLFKSTRDAPLTDLPQNQEPVVTVMESTDENFPVGMRMRLFEAESRVEEVNHSYWDSEEPEGTVKFSIDYTMDGEMDRYWLSIQTGPGQRSMLEQMKWNMEALLNDPHAATARFYDAPVGLDKLLHETFGPQLHNDLKKLSTRVLDFFQQHCTISRLEEQLGAQAMVMPEKERDKFLRTMRTNISELRTAANTGQVPDRAQERTVPDSDETPPRQSVKVKLNRIKKEQAAQNVLSRSKARPAPER